MNSFWFFFLPLIKISWKSQKRSSWKTLELPFFCPKYICSEETRYFLKKKNTHPPQLFKYIIVRTNSSHFPVFWIFWVAKRKEKLKKRNLLCSRNPIGGSSWSFHHLSKNNLSSFSSGRVASVARMILATPPGETRLASGARVCLCVCEGKALLRSSLSSLFSLSLLSFFFFRVGRGENASQNFFPSS